MRLEAGIFFIFHFLAIMPFLPCLFNDLLLDLFQDIDKRIFHLFESVGKKKKAINLPEESVNSNQAPFWRRKQGGTTAYPPDGGNTSSLD